MLSNHAARSFLLKGPRIRIVNVRGTGYKLIAE